MTEERSTFTVTYGGHTFRHSSTKVACFALGLADAAPEFKAKGAIQKVYGEAVDRNTTLASKDGYEDHGKWYRTKFAANGRGLLFPYLKKTLSGAIHTACQLIIYPCDTAPVINVTIRATADRLATQEEVSVFFGRGFVMSPEEASDTFGLRMSSRDVKNFFDEEEVDEEFDVEVISRGQSEKPEVVKSQGRSVIIKPRGRRRVITR